MLSFNMSVMTPLWQAFQTVLPEHKDTHPLKCHNPRTEDLTCFAGIILKLSTGLSWDDAGRMVGASRGSLTRRRKEWQAAGLIENLVEETLLGLDSLQGLSLKHVSRRVFT